MERERSDDTREAGPESDIAAVARIDAVSTILDVVCRSTGMGFAAVARVTESRWIACQVRDEIAFGLVPGGELKVESTICHEIRQNAQAVVIDHVDQDPCFRTHHTPLTYGFQSYISMPIFRRGGEFFGTLCAIDPRPHKLNTPETLGMFRLFADLIGFHLDTQDRLARSEAALLDERQSAELREQFIAVLGHDLRNPLAAISAGAGVLRKMPLNDAAWSVATRIQKSVHRMATLIDDVMDFARGRLGSGLSLDINADKPLAAELEHVVAELRAAWPERRIDALIALAGPVRCDRGRISQLLSNLVANALTHGAADQPISVRVSDSGGRFTLAVANRGEPIPTSTLDKLFEPFFRGSARPSQQGLGLGLYIVSEIARAHGGSLDVVSTPEETRFTFSMPVK